MDIHLTGHYTSIQSGVEALESHYRFTLKERAGIQVNCQQTDNDALKVVFDGEQATITYQVKSHFFRAFGLFLEAIQNGQTSFSIMETPQFKTVGPMFDLSRNAVLSFNTFKDLCRKLAIMGCNSAMLYMEDTYEVKEEPYFGYMRGRLTEKELSEMDDYAHQFGIELIPCIQTLAHLEEFLKWDAAYSYRDTRGALLLENETTYTLLENMITSVTKPFRSKQIHIGMDEAEEVGRGRFLNENGYQARSELMLTHLNKVIQITDALGLQPKMWSDMFLKLASETGDRYSQDTVLPEEIIQQTPDNLQLVYWQYNQTDKKHYDRVLREHKRFRKTPAFAGGTWIWNTFAPNYGFSKQASEQALMACKEAGVEDVFVTLWGDDGNENNIYHALYGIQLYAEHAYHKSVNEEHLARRLRFTTGIDKDVFLTLAALDTPPGVKPDNLTQTNPSKFLLWQDVLLGLFDKHVEGLDLHHYYMNLNQRLADIQRALPQHLKSILNVPAKLAKVLGRKGTIGIELKDAYDTSDKTTLRHIANETLKNLIQDVQALRDAHRKQWFELYKPFGWEIIDIRYGGLTNRLETTIYRINAYLDGQITDIEELEQDRLYFSPHINESSALGWCSYYYRIASPNVFFHVLPI